MVLSFLTAEDAKKAQRAQSGICAFETLFNFTKLVLYILYRVIIN